MEPLVEKLVEVGADVNAVNSFGYSCMLEACHRGYIVVAKTLLKGKVDLAYIPSEALASESPFSSAPCQSPLAEAARSGFFKVVQVQYSTVINLFISFFFPFLSVYFCCH